MKKGQKDIIEFPDSTVNVQVKFSEKDMKFLDESEKTDTIFLYYFVYLYPKLIGLISTIIGIFSYEWQRMYGSCLTRTPRASFNYSDLLAKDQDYIPHYTMGWLLGERPEAVSPTREPPSDPKFHR
ncbi:hypothetical protein NECAME_19427 [Necator americanus]|uniref:Uncharacterized protein n=1 Tax=Necator americanus TaxID=51031 RepID=W2SLG9_NECAM|nr:hypothetical protein NECAME_19427 [Necator americanus]ETN70455.1 hypothetical protein NECAME_19427 [Necator americanus]